MTTHTREELEGLWDEDGLWNGERARDVCVARDLFVAYVRGVESGKVRHYYAGPRAITQSTQRSQSRRRQPGRTQSKLVQPDDARYNALSAEAEKLWQANAIVDGRHAKNWASKSQFIAYFVGKRSGGERGLVAGAVMMQDTPRPTYDDIADVTERAQVMWDSNAVYRGEKVRTEFVSAQILAAYLKGVENGTVKHLIHPTNG